MLFIVFCIISVVLCAISALLSYLFDNYLTFFLLLTCTILFAVYGIVVSYLYIYSKNRYASSLLTMKKISILSFILCSLISCAVYWYVSDNDEITDDRFELKSNWEKKLISNIKLHEANTYSYNEAVKLMNNMTLEEVSEFFIINYNQNEYLIPYYIDSVLPLLSDIPYKELYKIYTILSDSPINDYVLPIYLENKESLSYQIIEEQSKNRSLFIETLKNEIIPIMELDMDSVLYSDIARIVNDYSGGLFEYKKIGFLFGRNERDFKEYWDKTFTNNNLVYDIMLLTYINDYLKQVEGCRNEYYREFIPSYECHLTDLSKAFKIKMNFTNEHRDIIKMYTSGEGWDYLSSFAKDISIDVIAGLTGGSIGGPIGSVIGFSTGLIASVGLSVYDVINDLKEISPEELLISNCVDLTFEDINNSFEYKISQLDSVLVIEDKELLNTILNNL